MILKWIRIGIETLLVEEWVQDMEDMELEWVIMEECQEEVEEGLECDSYPFIVINDNDICKSQRSI